MRTTKADLSNRLAVLECERTLLHFALAATINGDKPTAVESWQEDDDYYTVSLYRPTAPHGGFVICTFHYTGQTDTHSVAYAEAWVREMRSHGIAVGRTALAIAAERLETALRRAQRWAQQEETVR